MKANDEPSTSRLRPTLRVRTKRRTELQDVTDKVEAAVRESGCADGVCYLYRAAHHRRGDDQRRATIRQWRKTSRRFRPVRAARRRIPRTPKGNSDSHIKTALRGRRRQCGSSPANSHWAVGSGFSSPNLTARAAVNSESRLCRIRGMKMACARLRTSTGLRSYVK